MKILREFVLTKICTLNPLTAKAFFKMTDFRLHQF